MADYMLKNIYHSFIGASAVIFGTFFFPAHQGIVLGLSRYFSWGKGYPFVFYMPGGSDYGPSFYFLSFVANFGVCWVVILLAIFLVKKFSRTMLA